MAVIRRSDSDALARSAIVLDLGDLKQEAMRLERQSLAGARAILEEARRERERIVAGAREEGLTSGHAEGLARGLDEGRAAGRAEALESMKKQLEPLRNRWAVALEEFTIAREEMMIAAKEDVLRFAFAFAERLTRRAFAADPSIVRETLAAALEQTLRPTRLVIEVHPDDQPLIEEVLPGLAARSAPGAQTEMLTNTQLARGSVVLRADSGVIDASLDTQIARMAEALLPSTDAPSETGENA